jgi:hypothetical protein
MPVGYFMDDMPKGGEVADGLCGRLPSKPGCPGENAHLPIRIRA